MEPHNSIFAKIRGARFAPPMGAMPPPLLYMLASGQMVYGFYSLFVCLIRTNSFITDHCVCSPGVSFTLFTVLLDASLTMVKLLSSG